MRSLIIIAAILVPSSLQQGTTERVQLDLLSSQAGRDLCYIVRDWKGIMKAKHPKQDRSIPGMARLCGMRDD